MIKINELRVGNWFYWNNPATKPEQINVYDFESIDQELNIIYPIPLTPEILEKAGFEYNDILDEENSYWYIPNKWIAIYLDSNRVSIGGSSDPDRHHWIENFKYVHELQNLYFCLLGEELEINL